MKRFNELTQDQQEDAVRYALKEMKECIDLGLIKFDKSVRDEVLVDYARSAAEDAWYSQPFDKIIADIASEE